MKIFRRTSFASIYGVFFALSILYFFRLTWSLFTESDKQWEYFFNGAITLFIGLVIWGATNPKK
jgi:hypothetical protein